MKRITLLLLVTALIALPAAAVEVHLRDGTVIEASAYTVTGSYVMLTLADGHQVAYDVADVDLAALRSTEQAGGDRASQQAAEEAPPSLSQGRQLAMPSDQPTSGGLAITDADVKHVRGGAPEAEGEAAGEAPSGGGPPPGYSVGGRVVLDNLRVTSQGDDKWMVEGEVVNRSPQPVLNVKVQLRTVAPPGQTPWIGEVAVRDQLMPGEKAAFSQSFSAQAPTDKAQPDVRASVMWMQRGTPGEGKPGDQAGASSPGQQHPPVGYE